MTQICAVTPVVRKAIFLVTVLKFGDRDDETEVGTSKLKRNYNIIIFSLHYIQSTFRYLSHNLISYLWLKFYVAIDFFINKILHISMKLKNLLINFFLMSLSGHFLIKSLFVPNGLFTILMMQFIIDIENSDSNGYIICLK